MLRSTLDSGRLWIAAGSIWASCITPCAAADDVVTLDIGGYRLNARNDIRVGGPTGSGASFNVERAGAPENETVPRLDGTIRFFERHRIRFMFLDSSREGSTTTDRDISFQDTVVPAGAPVNAEFNMRHVELDYLYSIWKSATTEVALSVGAHSTRMEVRLNAPSFNIDREASANGPLPMIGIAGTTRLGQNWELLGHLYGMKASVGDFSGNALAYRIGGRYFFTPNFGIGLVYTGINYNFDVSRNSWTGELDASNRGGELFLTLRF